MNQKLDILFHHQDFVVCIKPIGIDSEKQMPELIKEQLNTDVYPLHRLDLNVGGVMVYALNKQAAALLSKTIQDNKMIKEYVALVHGSVEESGIYEDLLFKDSHKNKVFVVKKERKGVKKASLEFKCIDRTEDTSLVHIRLHTGRSHQIRVQFASRKTPLVGDHKYGSRDKIENPMLFSCRITFPYKGNTYSYEAMPQWASRKEI